MRLRSFLAGVATVAIVIGLFLSNRASAQSSTPTGDAAVNALIAEVRALRADMQAAFRSQLRAQMLLGRVQMQESRLVYFDKQRLDAANAAGSQTQIVESMQAQLGTDDGCGGLNIREQDRRDCEADLTMRRKQLASQANRAQQLRSQ